LLSESGRLEFEEFITLAAKFIIEEDAEAMEKELREAFRLYDKEGKFTVFLWALLSYIRYTVKTQ
jgi:Ca2+-binding EF-hand superfamily protein